MLNTFSMKPINQRSPNGSADLQPGAFCIIEDNVEAMRVLVGHNKLHCLKHREGFNAAHVAFSAKKHWVLGVNYRGHELPEENGYMVIAWPKEIVDKAEFHKQVANLLTNTIEGKMLIGSAGEPGELKDN